MSYKRKPQGNIAFTVSVTPNKRNKVEDEEIVAILAPFNSFPRVEFSSVNLNSTTTQTITLRNPNKNAVHVELTKLPEKELGFQWSDTKFEILGETETCLTIAWTPLEYGSSRHNIKIVNVKNKKVLSEIILISSTVDPPKNTRKCLRSQSNKVAMKQSVNAVKNTSTTVSRIVEEDKENVHHSKTSTSIQERQQRSTFVQSSKRLQTAQQSLTVIKTRSRKVVKSTVNVQSEQVSQQLFVDQSTPRRATYEVIAPGTSSRRSTYSLRNQKITNIIDVEREKQKFEAIASPGLLNDSLEKAASKLAQNESFSIPAHFITNNTCNVERKTSFKRLSEELDAFNFSSISKASSDSSKHTGNLSPKLCLEDVKSISDRFNLDLTKTLDLNQLVSCTLSSQHSPRVQNDSEEFSSQKTVKNISDSPQFEISEKSSLFKSRSHVTVDLDIFDLSPIITSSRNNSEIAGSLELEHQLNDFSFDYQNIDSQQRNTNDTFTKTLKNYKSNRNLSDIGGSYSNLNDIETKAKVEPSESSSSRSEVFSDSLELKSSETDLTKRDPQNIFDKVSDAGVPPNLLDAPSKDTTKTEQKPEIWKINQTFIQQDPYNVVNKISVPGKASSTINCYEATSKDINQGEQNPVVIENTFEDKILNITSKTFVDKNCHQNIVDQVSPIGLLSSTNLSGGPFKDIIKTEQKPIIWDISPPKNEQEKSVNSFDHIPLIKKALSTRNIPQTKSLSQKITKNIVPMKTKMAVREIQPGSDVNDSENVFMVPKLKIKRSSTLPKSCNTSPPKMRKMSQDFKVKRLATPVHKKSTLTSSNEQNKKNGFPSGPCSLPRPTSLLKRRKSVKVTDWLPVRKLKLSTGSCHSQEDLTGESIVDFSAPDPFIAATSLNPFCEGNLYYDAKWLEDQENELIAWTGRMLQPPSELQLDRDQSERGPLHRLNALRATTFSLLVSAETTAALAKVKVAVDKNVIAIRNDKQLHVDLGLQDKIIRLLMCYNPLWLRLCLEAIYQCNIHLKCHSDQAGLKNFIRNRVVSDEYIKSKYSHPTIPNLWLPEFEVNMKKFTLYKFLVLVYLLDLVKTKKVMLHDPCLFNKDSKIKSSKDILIEFNKDFISGSGDLTKILRLKGYNVVHSQSYLHEFDFTITNRSELRDGVRLTKLAEILTGDNTLCSKLRVPAIDNFQKEHNAKIALLALKNARHSLPQDVLPKDISDGHKEKTLSLLWHLRGIIQKRSVHLIIKMWRETKELRRDRKYYLKVKRSVIKIQKWYRRIKQVKGMSEEELKRAKENREYFLKLKSAALLVQRQFRKKREAREAAKRSNAAGVIQKWYKRQTVMIKEREKYKVLKSAAITVQRAYRRYKWHKLSSEIVERNHFLKLKGAAIVIQQKYKAYQLKKVDQLSFIQIKKATITIQRRYRSYYHGKTARKTFIEIKTATVVVQRKFRSNKLAKKDRESFLRHKAAALVLQKWFRAMLIRRQEQQRFDKLKASVLMVQRRFRANRLSKSLRQEFMNIKSAALTLQRKYRAMILAKKDREDFIIKKEAVILIQTLYRSYHLQRKDQEAYSKLKYATIFIQRKFRANYIGKREQIHFSQLKASTLMIQRKFKANKLAKLQRDSYLILRSKVIYIQRQFRANSSAKHQCQYYLNLKSKVIFLQRKFRSNQQAKLQLESYINLRSTVIYIQRRFRANCQAKLQRESYLNLKSAVISLQRRFRANRQAKLQRESYINLRSTVISIQRKFRANRQAKLQRESYLNLKSTVVSLQKRLRANQQAKVQRRFYINLQSKVIFIQRIFRANHQAKVQHQSYNNFKSTVISIQRRFRANCQAKLQRESYLNLKSAVISLQRRFRANRQAKLQRESYINLRLIVISIQRRFRANRQAKLQRESYLNLKSTVVSLQKRLRANQQAKVQRRFYINLQSKVIFIQRIFRANHHAKVQRQSYNNFKSTVISIQRRFRANCQAKLQRESYLNLKSAVISLQRRFRANRQAKLQRESYINLRLIVISIQRRFRANRQAKLQRESYLNLKSTVVSLQKRLRANQQAKVQRRFYINLQSKVIFIQRIFRANHQAKVQRQSYKNFKSTVISIQRRFRANCHAKLQRESYLNLKSAVISLQRRFRANRQANLQRETYLNLKTTVISLQRRFRATQQAKAQCGSYNNLKSKVISIQRRFRANRQAKLLRDSYLNFLSTVIYIQRRFRANRQTKLEHESYLNLRSTVISLQRRFRGNQQAKLQRESYLNLKSTVISLQRRFRATQQAKAQCGSYNNLRSKVISIQRRFRANRQAKLLRDSYLNFLSKVFFIQRRFRANRQAKFHCQSYMNLRSTVIFIQRRFRENRQAKLECESYKKLRAMAISIQRRFRAILLGRLENQSYVKLKSTVILIQRRFRTNNFAKRQRKSYLSLRSAVISTQRKFRANHLKKLERESFVKLRSSVIYIQQKFRAKLQAKLQRESYIKLRLSVINIQRRFKANCLAKVQRECYLKLRTTVLYIQRKFRANRLAKLQQGSYIKLKVTAIYIQRKLRANWEAKAIHQNFIKKRSAAILIQRNLRAMIFRRKFINHVGEIKLAAISVQRRFRAKSLARKEREYFLKLVSATIFVQRRFRLLRQMQFDRQSFVRLKSTVMFVQKQYRAKCLSRKERQYFLKLKSTVLLVQRRYRMKRLTRAVGVVESPAESTLEAKSNAAMKIQAAWRGKMVRRRVAVPKPKIEPSDAVRFRHTISNRGKHFLPKLHSFNKLSVAELLKALYNLDCITVLSSDQCEYFATHGAVRILFDIIKGSYKAFGVDRGIELCLLIILNLYRSPKTAAIVWKDTLASSGIQELFDLMLKFRQEKTSTVFCKAATLVWVFANDPNKVEVMKKSPKVMQIIKYMSKSFDKIKQPTPSTTKKVKSVAASKKFPALKPNWGNYFNDPRAFDDKSFAYESVMDILQIKV